MRKIVLLAAMLIAPGMAAEPAEAGGRGHHGQHQFAPPAFSHHRYVQPRHFGHRGSVAVFKFHNRSFGVRHGRPTFVRPPHFRTPHVWRPHYRSPPLTFGRHPQGRPWSGFRTHQGVWWGRPHHPW